MSGLFDKLRGKPKEPPVEMLDPQALRDRIGEPLSPKKPAPPASGYRRADGRPEEERSWRRVAGLRR